MTNPYNFVINFPGIDENENIFQRFLFYTILIVGIPQFFDWICRELYEITIVGHMISNYIVSA